jgi:hypothetical protein
MGAGLQQPMMGGVVGGVVPPGMLPVQNLGQAQVGGLGGLAVPAAPHASNQPLMGLPLVLLGGGSGRSQTAALAAGLPPLAVLGARRHAPLGLLDAGST